MRKKKALTDHSVSAFLISSTEGGSRTHTPFRTLDFESEVISSQVATGNDLENRTGDACTSACTSRPDFELLELVEAWGSLSRNVRSAILALVKASALEHK